jgi:hypothetical protein
MSSSRPYVFSALAAVMTLALPLEAQSIVSTHSGVIHFFEGAVYLDGQPVESRSGDTQRCGRARNCALKTGEPRFC